MKNLFIKNFFYMKFDILVGVRMKVVCFYVNRNIIVFVINVIGIRVIWRYVIDVYIIILIL